MRYDIVCFSHLRWNFVFQRPQHLLKRFASANHRVFYIEEPVYDSDNPYYEVIDDQEIGIFIIVPHLSDGKTREENIETQRYLVDELMKDYFIDDYISWYYTPMALEFSNHLNARAVIYDCMDELSGFKFAPQQLRNNEKALMNKADVMFTGGRSVYEAKKHLHHNIYSFPSSIDKDHFSVARKQLAEPEDQKNIPHPRIGFYGVIDERFDIDLLRNVATLKPDYHFIILGPVAKIDKESLPVLNNIHYLGCKDYKQLPEYLSGWDIAMMPFALNEATEFISPTKTPEYLAGGKPVISTPIKDVVNPYGDLGLVHIVSTAEEFTTAAEQIVNDNERHNWLLHVDSFLAGISWDKTWKGMVNKIEDVLERNNIVKTPKVNAYV